MTMRSLKECVVKIKDGSTPANYFEIKFGDGTIQWKEGKTREYIMDKGIVDQVRDGDDVPMDLSFSGQFEYYTGVAAASHTSPTSDIPVSYTLADVLKQVNSAAGWDSTDSDACAPYAVDIEVVWDPDCTTGDVETTTFPDFRYESIDFDVKAATISVSGKCNAVEPTSTRA